MAFERFLHPIFVLHVFYLDPSSLRATSSKSLPNAHVLQQARREFLGDRCGVVLANGWDQRGMEGWFWIPKWHLVGTNIKQQEQVSMWIQKTLYKCLSGRKKLQQKADPQESQQVNRKLKTHHNQKNLHESSTAEVVYLSVPLKKTRPDSRQKAEMLRKSPSQGKKMKSAEKQGKPQKNHGSLENQ